MRDYKIIITCDICDLTEHTSEPAVSPTYAMACGDVHDGIPVMRGLEVCEVHKLEVESWLEILAKLPRIDQLTTTPQAPAKQAPVARPVPGPKLRRKGGWLPKGSGMNPATCDICQEKMSQGALIGHIWKKHAKLPRPAIPKTHCPDCNQFFGTPQGVSTHRRVVHKYSAFGEAVDAAIATMAGSVA